MDFRLFYCHVTNGLYLLSSDKLLSRHMRHFHYHDVDFIASCKHGEVKGGSCYLVCVRWRGVFSFIKGIILPRHCFNLSEILKIASSKITTSDSRFSFKKIKKQKKKKKKKNRKKFSRTFL